MNSKRSWSRLLSLAMALAMLISVASMSAQAAVDLDDVVEPDNVTDAKDELATVDITQIYRNAKESKETDKQVHDYRLAGDTVQVDYSATLEMTPEMAIYLQHRQKNLMKAEFQVTVNMDMEWLEFRTPGDTVTMKFSSTFLKPTAGVKHKLVSVKDGVFTYELTMPKKNITSQMVIPMELIVYYDAATKTAYSYDEAKVRFADQPLMYENFTEADWMHEIQLELAEMTVRDEMADTVTTNSSTWHWIKANGTVDGTFAYISDPADTIGQLVTHEKLGYVTELEFGNESTIEEWTSNEVSVLLKRSSKSSGGGSSVLNTEDHYSYIIGYKDGYVRPYGNITRGEVATIFFRMLTDEARDKYWAQTNPYSDSPIDLWCNNAISTLTNMGVIDGFNDGTFRPYGKITRAQFAKIAVGFFETTAEEYQGYFTDVEPDAWYTSYIEAASRVGLIQGFEDGTFRPNVNITRAQTCVIVNRALDRHPAEHHLLPTSVMVNWPDNRPGDWYYADMMEATNSHDYVWQNTVENGEAAKMENWTKKLPQRDWAAFEHAWSDAHSAEFEGEVVD